MLGLRGGHTLRNVPAHHGIDLKAIANPAKAARTAAAEAQPDSWTPPVLGTVGVKEEGIEELIVALDRHFDFLTRTGGLRQRRRKRLRERVIEVVERKVRQRLWDHAPTNDWIESRIIAMESGDATPFGVADELLARSGEILAGSAGPGGPASADRPRCASRSGVG